MRLHVTPPAEADVRDIYEWYGEHGRELPTAFRDSLNETFLQILRHPLGYPKVHGGLRRALLGRFPYGVFYLVENTEIVILGVFHGRRDPSVWKSRVDA